MTHATPDSRPPRLRAEYRWTNRKAHSFLDALAQHGKVAAAARAVGMTRQSACRLGQRIPVVADDAFWSSKVTVPPAKATLSERKATLLPPKVTVPGLFASGPCNKCNIAPDRRCRLRPGPRSAKARAL